MNKLKFMGVTASIILTSTISVAGPIAKQLAGPAEEIELMQKASPESSAIVSKHAMISIDLSENAEGQMEWKNNLLIDGDNPKVLLFSPNRENWLLSVRGVGSQKSNQSIGLDFITRETSLGMGSEQFPATQFDLQNLKSGRYEFAVSADKKEAANGYLLVSSDSPYRLKSYVSSAGQLVGDVINLNALAFDDSEFTVVKNDLQLIQTSFMRITAPDGTVKEVSMFDDGLEFDKAAFDGEFNGNFKQDCTKFKW